MKQIRVAVSIVVLVPALAVAQQQENKSDQKPARSVAVQIADALSAAPVSITANASVAERGGAMRQLRAGKNGWVCYPSSEAALRKGIRNPMCMDEVGREWMRALRAKDRPNLKRIGVSYQLQGDAGSSNSDPFARGPTPTNDWSVGGPTLMVLVPNAAMLDGVTTDRRSGGPWVMWKGTPYAHLMVPAEKRSR